MDRGGRYVLNLNFVPREEQASYPFPSTVQKARLARFSREMPRDATVHYTLTTNKKNGVERSSIRVHQLLHLFEMKSV